MRRVRLVCPMIVNIRLCAKRDRSFWIGMRRVEGLAPVVLAPTLTATRNEITTNIQWHRESLYIEVTRRPEPDIFLMSFTSRCVLSLQFNRCMAIDLHCSRPQNLSIDATPRDCAGQRALCYRGEVEPKSVGGSAGEAARCWVTSSSNKLEFTSLKKNVFSSCSGRHCYRLIKHA